MIPSYVVYPFAGMFIVLGGCVTVLGIRKCKEARGTWSWRSTEGTVRGAKVIETSAPGINRRSTLFQPEIAYEYLVEEQPHTGKRIRIGEIASSSRYARQVVTGYRVGNRVTVYYNPNSPQDAVLRRGNDSITMAIPAIGIVFVLVGAGICLCYHMFKNGGF